MRLSRKQILETRNGIVRQINLFEEKEGELERYFKAAFPTQNYWDMTKEQALSQCVKDVVYRALDPLCL